MDSRRFGTAYRSREYTLARTIEVYSTYYDVRYPGHERQAGRPLRTLADLPAPAGARRGLRREVGLGAPELVRAERGARATSRCARAAGPDGSGRRRSAPSTSPTREAAALFDETSFAKIEVSGDGAAGIPRATVRQPGRARRRRDHLHLDAEQAWRDRVRLHRHPARRGPLPHRHRHGLRPARSLLDPPARSRGRLGRRRGRHVALRVPRLWGPQAREILQPLTTADLSNEAFPLHAGAELDVGPVPCLALRVTYVGELGWELYCPMEFGLRLWDAIWEPGREHGLVAGGYKAIDSCRLEKGYRVWGADITPEDTPYEAGLDFAVKLDKGDFVGRDALLERARARAPARLPRPRRPAGRRARLRARADRGRARRAASRAAATATRSSARSPTPTCPPRAPSRGSPSRWRSSASGCAGRSPPSRLYDPAGSRSAPSARVH